MNTSAMISMIGIGLIGTVMTVLLRQYRPEFAVVVTVITSIMILFMMFQWIQPILEEVRELLGQLPALSEHTQILLKAVGICFLTQLACGLCRDAGEGAIAAHIETAGKVAILVISLPMFGQILELVVVLLGL